MNTDHWKWFGRQGLIFRLAKSRKFVVRLVVLAALILMVNQALILFPGESLKDRTLYRIALLREPTVLLTREASSQSDSAFPKEQLDAMRTALQWATTTTTSCQRQAIFGGQTYSSNVMETKIIEGDRPVCFDPGFSIGDPLRPCVVYSFGISNDWSFDDAMARFGCEVHAFDPSIDVPEGKTSTGVNFHRMGLGRNNHVNVRGWKIRTLDTIMRELGHIDQRLSYLKLDGEGAEFDMLAQQLLDVPRDQQVLNRFDQIGMEIHFRINPEREVHFFSGLPNITRALEKDGWKMAASEPNKIYNVWFRFPGMTEPLSHMFDVFLLNRNLVPDIDLPQDQIQ